MSSEQITPFAVTQPLWFVQTTYGLAISLLLLFGTFGTLLSFKMTPSTKNIKAFIAATRSTGLLVICFAFYGPVLGTSGIVIVSAQAGFLGGGWQCVASFTIYEFLVPIVIALCGLYIIKSKQDIISFVHFMRFRFGVFTFILTLLVMIFNTAVLTLQEYITVGAIFKGIVDPQSIVKRPDILMVIMVAGTVAIYTALGGLRVSLITDLFQCGGGFVLLIIIVVFFAVTFRYPLSRDTYNNLSLGRGNAVGKNSWGANLVVLFVPFYDEANWQRVWASKNTKTLLLGAFIGGLQVAIMAIVMGALGVFPLWAGLPPLDESGNLTVFTNFEKNLSSWIIIILVLMLLLQSQSFIDSLQNGMLATVLTFYVSVNELIQYRRQRGKRADQEDFRYGEYGFQQQLADKFKRASIEHPNIRAESKFVKQMREFGHTFYRTLGARLVVVAIQIVLVPISLKDISILVLSTIQGNITTMLFCGQILGLFITKKYYTQLQCTFTTAICFVAPHVYSHIKLKTGLELVPYSFRNVFLYTWNPLINNLDYGIIVTIVLAGLAASVITTCIMMIVYAFKEELTLKNMKKELFIVIERGGQY